MVPALSAILVVELLAAANFEVPRSPFMRGRHMDLCLPLVTLAPLFSFHIGILQRNAPFL